MQRQHDPVWHPEVISEMNRETLERLQRSSALDKFYLAGGTGLALRIGHRRSLDFDFFSPEAFDEDALLRKVQECPDFVLSARSPSTLHAQVQGTKVSFLGYTYPVLFPSEKFLGVDVADPRDIACMKISAIASRGTRRDFVDLFLASRQYGLDKLLDLFRTKFAQVNYSMVHIFKSLTYFDDAEKDPLPDMLVPLSWQELKEYFMVEVPRML